MIRMIIMVVMMIVIFILIGILVISVILSINDGAGDDNASSIPGPGLVEGVFTRKRQAGMDL